MQPRPQSQNSATVLDESRSRASPHERSTSRPIRERRSGRADDGLRAAWAFTSNGTSALVAFPSDEEGA